MPKPVFKNLLDQQIAVLKATSILVLVFMPLFLALLYYGFGVKQTLPVIILVYVFVVLFNLISLPIHKKPVITYLVLISSTFIVILSLSMVTGGMLSPFVFIIVILPVFAFYTSRKQGKIWFGICFLALIFLECADYFNIPVSNVVPAEYCRLLLFIIVLFVTILTSLYLYLVKADISRAHKLFSHATKDLEDKSKRMENSIMLVNYSTDLMCVINAQNMTFDEVNPEFKILLGYELSQLRDEPVNKVLKDDILPKLKALEEDGVISFESPVLCRNGDKKMFNWSATAKNGKLYAYAREKN